ncbi:MAG: hypothetical protein GEV06_09455 [Luteitalea sp.]|nr:hypothetical protein [Luteitalea sp.]
MQDLVRQNLASPTGTAPQGITSTGRLRAPDADIFISFAQARMHALRAMTAEVDAEYVRDPTDDR